MSLCCLNLGTDTRSILIEAIGSFFHAVEQLHDRHTHGGYFCVADGDTGTPYFILGIGTVHPEKISKYIAFTQEKAKRLASHPDHQSSAQSRDPVNDQYAGAIRAGCYILSFSGLPEALDEGVMLVTAVRAELMSAIEALSIARGWEGNDYHEVAVVAGLYL